MSHMQFAQGRDLPLLSSGTSMAGAIALSIGPAATCTPTIENGQVMIRRHALLPLVSLVPVLAIFLFFLGTVLDLDRLT
jgi:hypothetical protein